MTKYTGLYAYTRRRQRDGMVKLFFRDTSDGRMWIVTTPEAAKKIPANQPMTIDWSHGL